ncbi:hypothetical protein L6452_37208 [Arctium lappa]|uniref:Uncharacterized protein n=1 Tax=Arctium lappa TaxID=4217 RepID=A0ACB8Y2B0_ARCLA|nr:hypothetical protein L6452_37208 [Arctium lappa]
MVAGGGGGDRSSEMVGGGEGGDGSPEMVGGSGGGRIPPDLLQPQCYFDDDALPFQMDLAGNHQQSPGLPPATSLNHHLLRPPSLEYLVMGLAVSSISFMMRVKEMEGFAGRDVRRKR